MWTRLTIMAIVLVAAAAATGVMGLLVIALGWLGLAIGIATPAEQVWPWLVQLGYGRAGWYSYDWIDNGGQPSAHRIIPELQQLQVGDQILMLPGMGPRVREVEPNRYFVAGDAQGHPSPGGGHVQDRKRCLLESERS